MLSSSLFILMQLSCLWCAVCFEYFIRMRTLLDVVWNSRRSHCISTKSVWQLVFG